MAKAAKKSSAKKSVKKSAKKSVKKSAGQSAGGAGSAGIGKKLVVVESPAKAKTINKYLGSGFVVRASMGHVRDLPGRNPKGVKAPVPGVDLEHDFAPSYEPLAGRKKVLAELKKYAKSAPEVFLATDLDREGEAIAWHLAEAMNLDPARTRRVVFNEITKPAIAEAFAKPRQIDMDMVNAQQARRILDRIVGYQVSPLLWRKVAGGLSAGRVQSVAVRLIVQREREIDAFMPEEYWKIDAVFTPEPSRAGEIAQQWQKFLATTDEKGNGPTKKAQQAWLAEHGAFVAELARFGGKRFKADDEDAALALAGAMGFVVERTERQTVEKAKGPAKNRVVVIGKPDPAGPGFVVQKLTQRETRSKPYAPFTTASLQQTAASQLHFAARRTMRIAQQLYEGIEIPGEGSVGLITYMRTDSRNLSREAVGAVREMISQAYGPKYVPDKPNIYVSGDRAQEAHEAIRPTECRRHPENVKSFLNEEQFKLYRLIWSRFVACQMTPALWHVTEADIVAETPAGEAVFRAMGRTLGFDGFMRVAGVPSSGEQLLPSLTQGQAVGAVSIDPTQHFTQAPPRYTEASLVKALEADNIGRPSTYAAIIQTIQDRKYVEMISRAFHPTDLGMVVTDKLVKHFPKIFQVRFTAFMEDELDKVEQAQMDWVTVLREFYSPFSQQLETAAEEMTHAKAETTPSEYKCPDCGAMMEYRFGKNGKFLSCSKYPDCKKAMPIDRDGKPAPERHTNIACPLCNQAMSLRKGRFGPFLSCASYPDCKGVVNLDKKGFIKHPSPPPLLTELPCPKCDEKLNLRRGKRGPWLSCSKYPKCRGRGAWASLDDEVKQQLESALETHERANPQPIIHKLDGTPCGDECQPEIVEED
ncbi:MAG: type I DNA topoisomerase [Planctomycetota bacterium]|nr:MAG: type I DNA topoisomerase [Planctomycetota bacterium]